jgi:hypothetical protein
VVVTGGGGGLDRLEAVHGVIWMDGASERVCGGWTTRYESRERVVSGWWWWSGLSGSGSWCEMDGWGERTGVWGLD